MCITIRNIVVDRGRYQASDAKAEFYDLASAVRTHQDRKTIIYDIRTLSSARTGHKHAGINVRTSELVLSYAISLVTPKTAQNGVRAEQEFYIYKTRIAGVRLSNPI